MAIRPYDTQVKDLEESLKNQTNEYELIVSEQEISTYINVPRLVNEGLKKAKGDIIHFTNADFLYPDEKLFEKIIDKLSDGSTDVIFLQFYSMVFEKWRVADGGFFIKRETMDRFGEWDEEILGISGETFPFLEWCLDNLKFHSSREFTIDLNTQPYTKRTGKKNISAVARTWPTIEKVLRKFVDLGIGDIADIEHHKDLYLDKHDFTTHAPNFSETDKLYSPDGVYGTIGYASPGVSRGLICAMYLCQHGPFMHKKQKILNLGSGNAYEAVQFIRGGHECYTVELYHPKLKILEGKQTKALGQALPFRDKEFDLFFSCETMEHIPEQYCDMVLSEAKRVSEKVFFTIATRDDPPYCTHICLHNGQWWMNKFEEHGFTIKNAQLNARFSLGIPQKLGTGLYIVQFPEGVMIHAGC